MRNIEDTSNSETRWLSLLIAARWKQDTAMLNDLAAIDKSLRSRGISENEILAIQGALNRKSLFSFLNKARQQITESSLCNVLLYYSGHGFFTGTNPSNAQPGLLLVHDTQNENIGMVSWDEIFSILNTDRVTNLLLFLDC